MNRIEAFEWERSLTKGESVAIPDRPNRDFCAMGKKFDDPGDRIHPVDLNLIDEPWDELEHSFHVSPGGPHYKEARARLHQTPEAQLLFI